MKKRFPLHVPGKEDRRVVEAIKLELTKYVKRESRKTLPTGVDFWFFHCKVGVDAESARSIPLPDLSGAIESLSMTEAREVYVEIMASHGHRVKKSSPESFHRQEL
jgi:hypothetical protein